MERSDHSLFPPVTIKCGSLWTSIWRGRGLQVYIGFFSRWRDWLVFQWDSHLVIQKWEWPGLSPADAIWLLRSQVFSSADDDWLIGVRVRFPDDCSTVMLRCADGWVRGYTAALVHYGVFISLAHFMMSLNDSLRDSMIFMLKYFYIYIYIFFIFFYFYAYFYYFRTAHIISDVFWVHD